MQRDRGSVGTMRAYFKRVTSGWNLPGQPSYVGTFHGLGVKEWGAEPSPNGDQDSGFWEQRLPKMMVSIAERLDVGKRFDAVMVDEARRTSQHECWPASWLPSRNPRPAGLTIFSDEGQRVFARFGGMPECQEDCWASFWDEDPRLPWARARLQGALTARHRPRGQ